MVFNKAGDFLSIAAKKFKMSDQVVASVICTRTKKILEREFESMSKFWNPKKYKNGKLTIQAENSAAASDLFLRTHDILELFETEEFPDNTKIREILISRKDIKREEY
ncbi:MAG: DUF721 domain-containing protein [Candidatus Peregrinibacteria bacterium]|nr:DUF721 domain-containing protein [Candidatus Peregrinibacteria bacterium]